MVRASAVHDVAAWADDGSRSAAASAALASRMRGEENDKAPRPGFEPGAYSLGGSRSIQLSYRGLQREHSPAPGLQIPPIEGLRGRITAPTKVIPATGGPPGQRTTRH